MSINGVQDRDTLWIGGEWVPSTGSDTIEVVSPHSEEVIATVPHATEADVDAAVAAANEAFTSGPWPAMGPAERADVLTGFTAALAARATTSPRRSPPRTARRSCSATWARSVPR